MTFDTAQDYFEVVLAEVLNRGDADACAPEETIRRITDAMANAGLTVDVREVPVRFKDRDDDDDQMWKAHQLPDGRWAVRGNEGYVDWTYATDELEFVA